MPVFDVITVHEKQIAKIRTVRSEANIRKIVTIGRVQSIAYPKFISFENWYKFIHAKKPRKSRTNIIVKHTFT